MIYKYLSDFHCTALIHCSDTLSVVKVEEMCVVTALISSSYHTILPEICRDEDDISQRTDE